MLEYMSNLCRIQVKLMSNRSLMSNKGKFDVKSVQIKVDLMQNIYVKSVQLKVNLMSNIGKTCSNNSQCQITVHKC